MTKTNYQLEPGLLPVYRVFVWGRLLMFLIAFVPRLFSDPFTQEPFFIQSQLLSLSVMVILLIYLHVKWFQSKLGRYFFPLGIGMSLLETMVFPFIGMGNLVFRNFAAFWEPNILNLIPLILIAWQYNLRVTMIVGVLWGLTDISQYFVMEQYVPSHEAYRSVLPVISRSLAYIFASYVVALLIEAQRRQRHALIDNNLRLVQQAETIEELSIIRERNRLANDLHDTLAHTLSAIAVQLEAIASIWSPPPKAQTMLEQARQTAQTGLEETRRALQDLRSSRLESLGLLLALRMLAEESAQFNRYHLDLKIPEEIPHFSPKTEQTIYRIVQEAFANINRHSQAKNVSINLEINDNVITLLISDDGIGYDPSGIFGGFGLEGMRKRAREIGASLTMESSPGHGSTIELKVKTVS